MIEQIELKFGASPNSEPLKFDPGTMTVVVGANNSGKSLLLEEIQRDILTNSKNPKTQIISSINLNTLTKSDFAKIVFPEKQNIDFKNISKHEQISIKAKNMLGATRVKFNISWKSLSVGFDKDKYTGVHLKLLCGEFLLKLDGSTRLSYVKQQPSGDLLKSTYENHLIALFKKDKARKTIRQLTGEAFGKYFVIDPTLMTLLRVKMSSRPPEDNLEEQALDKRARKFFEAAEPIESCSDGVKAFTGILAAIFCDEFKSILIDEPEAFLHPPLRRKIGQILTETANERDGNVIASTHSSDFLMGCIQTGKPVNIVRLTYENEVATARIIPGEELQKLMRDPLLRSAGIIDALFHRGVIIGEGDCDRVFYEEINLRLLAKNSGSSDTLFANAIGKQTICKIIKPLRQIGVPAAAIVNIDIIKNKDLSALLRSAFVPDALVESWNNLKRKITEAFDNEEIDIKAQGIFALSQENQEVAKTLIDNIAEYGVFIVPVGELEGWLSHLNIEGKKTKWLTCSFDALGIDPDDISYVKPSNNDVWEFVDKIAGWIDNPNRKGIPVE